MCIRDSRFTANGDVAVAGSETVILDLDNVTATNHNGGALHFGPDGKLYIATGENAVPSNAQSLGNLLGKVLRINRDGTIPPDNPFFNQATGNNRPIWTLALRNPLIRPCTPYGCIKLLDAIGVSPRGLHSVVVGASNQVGRPMALELLLAGATVTICHRFTTNLAEQAGKADILVVAVGKPGLVRGDWVEFIDDGQTRRERLTWISPNRSLFLFSNRAFKSAISITPDALAHRLQTDTARLVEREATMFERALDGAIKALDKAA